MQTYYGEEEYFEPGGPIFVFVTPYIEDFEFWLEETQIAEIARELNGLIVAPEPRFFGDSRPTEYFKLIKKIIY